MSKWNPKRLADELFVAIRWKFCKSDKSQMGFWDSGFYRFILLFFREKAPEDLSKSQSPGFFSNFGQTKSSMFLYCFKKA